MDSTDNQPGGHMADPPEPSPRDAVREVVGGAKELKDYASQYLAAQADRLKLSMRKIVVAIVLGALAGVVGLVVVVMAVSLFLIGLAEAVAALLGGRAWAGNLIVGGGLLLVLAIGSWIGVRRYFSSSRKRTVERYEKRLRDQNQAHGHDARQRSAPGAAG